MIKAIIFDVGGTYAAGSFVDFVNKAYKLLGIDRVFSATEEIIFDENFNRGQIDYETCFRNFFGVPISAEQMAEIKHLWTTTWAPTPEMRELIQSLAQNYRLVILSNSDCLNFEKFKSEGWYQGFTELVLSHELGILKPEPEIYQLTLDRLQLPAAECLFIDDQEKVLIPARKLGMETIHFKSFDQFKKELAQREIKFATHEQKEFTEHRPVRDNL